MWMFDDPLTPDACHIGSHVLRGPGELRSLDEIECWGNETPGPFFASLAADPAADDEKLRRLFRSSTLPLRHPTPDMGPKYWPVPESWRAQLNWAGTTYLVFEATLAALVSDVDAEAIQRFPVSSPVPDASLEVIKVRRAIDCIDEQRTVIARRWPASSVKRVNRYEELAGIKLDTSRIPASAHLFYTEGDDTLIVSDVLARRMRESNVSGVDYIEVT
ncbi:MAG: hypothetical protein JWP97_3020 [Labilithrix sp.]|nr:hypothetical protein [Labilithrix sp.]